MDDIRNTLNTQPAMTGNMVASDGKVYNIIDLIKSLLSKVGGASSSSNEKDNDNS